MNRMTNFSRGEKMRSALRGWLLAAAFVWLAVVSAMVSPISSWGQEPVLQENRPTLVEITALARTKIVKIFGAGGFQGLEAYQTGILISDEGHILTAWSHVLDADGVTVFLHDGQRHEATLMGYDPRSEIAIIKIDVAGTPYFNLDESNTPPRLGDLVLALTNLYGVATGNEPVSVQHGTVTALKPVEANRVGGRFPYRGPVLIVDAITSNPGTPGGALVNEHGELVGVIGKDLKATGADIWLNYGLPINDIRGSIDDILSGKLVLDSADPDRPRPTEPMTLELLGLRLVPDVVGRTPPYVDSLIERGSAERAGLLPDDLILFVNDQLIASRRQVEETLEFLHRDDPVSITVQRGRETLTFELEAGQ